MNSTTGSAVEGGLLIAILLILGLASVYIPILGTILEFFWALPIVVMTVRQGLSKAITALVAATILLTLFVGPLLSIRLSISFGLIGLTIGHCLRRHYDAVRLFMTTLGAAFVAQLLSIAILFFVLDINLFDSQMTMMRDAFEQSFRLYSDMGVDDATLEQARASVEPTLATAMLLMPSILLIVALINTALSIWASRLVLRKLQVEVPTFPKFAEWRFPIGFLYLMAFALIGMYWGTTREINTLYEMSINANLLAMGVGLVQGLSLISFAADRFKLSTFVRRLIFVIVLLNGMLLQAVAFTGLFDMYFDYRRRLTQKK